MGIFGNFAKAILGQNDEKWPILRVNFNVPKA